MKPRAVLVDVSIDQGGCFETSRADDPLRPDLRGRRDPALLRHQHAGRGADHLDLRPDQRDPALRARAGRARRGRRAGARPGPAPGRQRRRRRGHPRGRRRRHRFALHPARRGARRARRLRSQLERRAMAATTQTTLRNFIGGEFVDSAERRDRGRPQPVDRRGHRAGAAVERGATSTAAVAAAKAAFETWSVDDPGRALDCAAEVRRRDRGARRRARRPRVGQRRQAARRRAVGRGAGDGRQHPLLRRRRAQHGGQGVGRVPRGPDLDHPPRAGRRRRPDRAVELPDDDGDLEDRPGAGDRQHARPQAGRDDAGHVAEARRDRGRALPARRLQRHLRPRRADRRAARHAPRRRHGLADRLAGHRQVDRRARRPTRSSACTSSSAAMRR